MQLFYIGHAAPRLILDCQGGKLKAAALADLPTPRQLRRVPPIVLAGKIAYVFAFVRR